MIQPIYVYGSEVLRKVAAEADLGKKDELTKLITDLKDTLAVADGCGLAAPQIGVSLRVVYVDGTVMEDVYGYLKDFRRVMINPTVLEEDKEMCEFNEGCLSVPGIYADVRRPKAIRVHYWNENFEEVTEVLDRFACRMVQHELAHLDGEIFVDRVAPIRKKLIAKKLINIAQGRVSARYKTKLQK